MPSPTHEPGARNHVPLEWLSGFYDDLSRYGAFIKDWPAENRRRAERVLAASQTARDDLADAFLVEEFLGRRQVADGSRDLAARIIAAQQALKPARVSHRPQAFVMLQAAFVIVIAAVGLMSGRWIMQTQVDYGVAGIFMICSDAFYL
jgi:hypothetical protein